MGWPVGGPETGDPGCGMLILSFARKRRLHARWRNEAHGRGESCRDETEGVSEKSRLDAGPLSETPASSRTTGGDRGRPAPRRLRLEHQAGIGGDRELGSHEGAKNGAKAQRSGPT